MPLALRARNVPKSVRYVRFSVCFLALCRADVTRGGKGGAWVIREAHVVIMGKVVR